jgi:hypothetical protein
MPRKPAFIVKLEKLRPQKPYYVQAPVGWWKDAKGQSQPPGSYADPSLRIDAEEQSNDPKG